MSYSVLSKYYDRLMTDFDYDAYASFVLDNVQKGAKGLDLAAGSGEMTVRLSQAGFKMTGSDCSTEMLTVATEKSKKALQDILFLIKDLNCLTISKKYDFITAVCDGFNYVSSQKNMEKAFCEIHNALTDNGKFIFDISTCYKLKKVVGDNFFYEDYDDLTYLWSNTLFSNRVEMSLTFFEKDGQHYQRYDEEQTQFFYPNEKVISTLSKCGFSVQVFNEKFKELSDISQRMIVVATKI